jgi:crotonobetainyl-CoA:carnitine CoA-transferase CaiB-like acyl-CoA transferase
VFETADSYLAIAMTPSLETLADLMRIDGLARFFGDAKALMSSRDEIKAIMADAIRARSTADWLAVLQPADIWCSEVLDWPQLLASEAWGLLDFEQTIERNGTVSLNALRGPIRIDGQVLKSKRAAPALGADLSKVHEDLLSTRSPVGSGANDVPDANPSGSRGI